MIALSALDAPALFDPGVLLARLGWASLAGGLFVAAVLLLTRSLATLPAGLRCALWWAAALKLLVALLWTAPLELPLLPAPEVPSAVRVAAAPASLPARGETPVDPTSRARSTEPAARAGAVPWQAVVAGLWLTGVGLGAVRLARELAAARELRGETRPAEPSLAALFHDLRGRLGVRSRVELRVSDRATGPLTLGPLRAVVLLPARDVGRLTRDELEMALGHELLHVRRCDLWAGWIPRIARLLFFFHPLAALAAREYLLAREAACDLAVLRELGAPPRSYGRLLLLWGSRRQQAPAPAGVAVAGASPSFLDLKRRLVMLQNPSSPSRRLHLLGAIVAALALAALLPLRIVAQAPTPPDPPEVPAAPSEPAVGAVPEPPDLPEAHLVVATPPAPPAEPERTRAASSTWSYTNDGEAWALIEGGGEVWMSGSSRDLRRIEALRSAAGAPRLWFRRGNHEYVVRDPAALERAREILEPQRELGRQQGELGARQGDLGAEQGKLGAQQGELGGQQGELGARQGELGAQMAALAAENARLHARRMAAGDEGEDFAAEEAALEERMERLEEQMEGLGQRQEELGGRQEALGRQQEALGHRQEALGEQQEELGRRQEEAARRARAELRELFDRAVAQGLAERVD